MKEMGKKFRNTIEVCRWRLKWAMEDFPIIMGKGLVIALIAFAIPITIINPQISIGLGIVFGIFMTGYIANKTFWK